MLLQGRDLSFETRGADVRLLQFELRLLDLKIPVEEIFENHFGEGTRQAVQGFQAASNLERTGEVDHVTAERINSEIRQRVRAEEVLEHLAEATRISLQMIDVLGSDTPDLPTQTERFSGALEAFVIALDLLCEFGAPDGLGAKVEKLLEIGCVRLEELAGSSGDDGSAAPFIVGGRTLSREAVMDCAA